MINEAINNFWRFLKSHNETNWIDFLYFGKSRKLQYIFFSINKCVVGKMEFIDFILAFLCVFMVSVKL